MTLVTDFRIALHAGTAHLQVNQATVDLVSLPSGQSEPSDQVHRVKVLLLEDPPPPEE